MKKKKNEIAENYLIHPPPLFFQHINLATNVAKTFLTLIDKQFPKDKRLSKIVDRNTIKLGNSCLPKLNRQSPIIIITHHNCTEGKNQLKMANYVIVG